MNIIGNEIIAVRKKEKKKKKRKVFVIYNDT